MRTLVIHPKDTSTDFLKAIYEAIECKVVTENISKSKLRDLIRVHDRILMLGHGTELGLIDMNQHRYVIDSTFVQLLREKICICIWCNANDFVEKYKLNAHYTGMFISEYEEALLYSIPTNDIFLRDSNETFAKAVRDSLDSEDFKASVIQKYDCNTSVAQFNKARIYSNLNTKKS